MLRLNLDGSAPLGFLSQFSICQDLKNIIRIDDLISGTTDSLGGALLIGKMTFGVAARKRCSISTSIILWVTKW